MCQVSCARNLIEPGDNVTLTCLSYREPAPHVIWLTPDGHQVDDLKLSLVHIRRNQGGCYACVAQNDVMKIATGELYVKLQGKCMILLS